MELCGQSKSAYSWCWMPSVINPFKILALWMSDHKSFNLTHLEMLRDILKGCEQNKEYTWNILTLLESLHKHIKALQITTTISKKILKQKNESKNRISEMSWNSLGYTVYYLLKVGLFRLGLSPKDRKAKWKVFTKKQDRFY